MRSEGIHHRRRTLTLSVDNNLKIANCTYFKWKRKSFPLKLKRVFLALQKWQMTTIPAGEPDDDRRRQRRPGTGRRRRKRPQSQQFLDDSSIPRTTIKFDQSEEDPRSQARRAHRIQAQQHQSLNYKSYRKPYSVAKQRDPEETGESAAHDLKLILKQAGSGLSLSELLQQKNLSLADVLSKKHSVLSVLSRPEPPSPVPTPLELNSGEMMMTGDDDEETQKHRRVPMFVQMPPLVIPTEEIRTKNSAPKTIPTISTQLPASGQLVNSSRPDRYKPIKEVVPRIRPDFANSNSKRGNEQQQAVNSTTMRSR